MARSTKEHSKTTNYMVREKRLFQTEAHTKAISGKTKSGALVNTFGVMAPNIMDTGRMEI